VSDLLRVLAVLGLIGFNALFVIAEYSVVTARRSALQPRADSGSKRAVAALKLMDDPVSVISTVQVGISAVGHPERCHRRAAWYANYSARGSHTGSAS